MARFMIAHVAAVAAFAVAGPALSRFRLGKARESIVMPLAW